MKSIIVATSLLILFGAATAKAQEDPVKARIALMKQNDADFKAVAFYALGRTTPYDADKVKSLLGEIAKQIETFPTLFPEGSESEKAKPEIWASMDDFKAHAEDLGTKVAAAIAAAPNGADALKATLGPVNAACTACHDTYRN